MNNIPKILHLMWDGSAMAYLQVLTVISFHRLNPDWRIIVWVPKKETSFGANTYVPDYTGGDYYPMFKELDYVEVIEVELDDFGIKTDTHFILCSDQLRMLILYSYGGVYSDFDVIWIRPMSLLPSMNCMGNPNDFEASVCYHYDTHGWNNIGIIIAEVGSSYINEIIQAQKRVRPPYSHQVYGTDLMDKLYPTYDAVASKHPHILGIRYNTLYPYNIDNISALYDEDKPELIQDEGVLCLHWFNGHRQSKAYINSEDYDRPCSMTSVLNYLKLNKGQL